VSREEAETFRAFREQHRRQVAMPETDFALVGDRARDAERLQTDAELFSCFGCGLHAALYRVCRAERISPDRVVECDALYAAHYRLDIDAF
jgi:hypothetical protein